MQEQELIEQQDSYPIHVLKIKLWEWEAIKENSNILIAKFGPEEHTCNASNEAYEKIKELKLAIRKLS